MGNAVVYDHIPRAPHEAQLDIAHHPGQKVDVLGHKKHRSLVIDIMPGSAAFVGKGYQQGPCAAGRVIDGHPSLLFDSRLEVIAVGHGRHHPAHGVRGEKLPFPFVAEVEGHKQLSKEVLVRISLHLHDYLRQHLRKGFQLLRGVSGRVVHVLPLPGFLMRPAHDVRYADGGHGDEILPHFPPGVAAAQAVQQLDDILLALTTETDGLSHDLPLRFRRAASGLRLDGSLGLGDD